MSPRLDAVLLDVGNTLVGMDLDLLAALAASEGVAVTAGRIGRAEAAARPALSRLLADGRSSETGDARLAYIRCIVEGLDLDGRDLDEVVRRFAAALRAVPIRRLWSRVLPGVPEALAALRAGGLTLVVVSNSDGSVEEGLTRLGLRAAVDAVVDSGRVGIEKPDPRIFAHALALAGSAPERTLHVGDLYAIDVVGARAAGIEAVLLDPYGDWHGVDCPRATDLAALVPRLAGQA